MHKMTSIIKLGIVSLNNKAVCFQAGVSLFRSSQPALVCSLTEEAGECIVVSSFCSAISATTCMTKHEHRICVSCVAFASRQRLHCHERLRHETSAGHGRRATERNGKWMKAVAMPSQDTTAAAEELLDRHNCLAGDCVNQTQICWIGKASAHKCPTPRRHAHRAQRQTIAKHTEKLPSKWLLKLDREIVVTTACPVTPDS